MPLTYAVTQEIHTIKKLGGSLETRRHLENLGFLQGHAIRVMQRTHGNLIVDVADTRIAISEELARKIII